MRQGTTAIAAPSYEVSECEQFIITGPPPIEAQAAPQNIPLTIAYEDEHLIVVDKPAGLVVHPAAGNPDGRSEEHTSELQSLMRISYAVFCLKKKKNKAGTHNNLITPRTYGDTLSHTQKYKIRYNRKTNSNKKIHK